MYEYEFVIYEIYFHIIRVPYSCHRTYTISLPSLKSFFLVCYNVLMSLDSISPDKILLWVWLASTYVVHQYPRGMMFLGVELGNG